MWVQIFYPKVYCGQANTKRNKWEIWSICSLVSVAQVISILQNSSDYLTMAPYGSHFRDIISLSLSSVTDVPIAVAPVLTRDGLLRPVSSAAVAMVPQPYLVMRNSTAAALTLTTTIYRDGCSHHDGSHPLRQIFVCGSRSYVPFYSWIADQPDTHEKLICQRTRRVTTIPRPPVESSRQGEFRFSGFHFLWSFFDLLIKKSQNMVPTKRNPEDLESPCRILACQGLRPF